MRSSSLLALALIIFAAASFAQTAPSSPVRRAKAYLDGLPPWPEARGAVANVRAKRRAADAAAAFLDLCLGRASTTDTERDAAVLDFGRGDDPLGSFDAWRLGLAAFWHFEEGAHSGRPHRSLPRLLARAAEIQNAEGGWGHGADMPRETYPSTLMVTTHFLLLAHATASRFGGAPRNDTAARALALLEAVQCENGAVPYGGKPYRKGPEAGRTAGAVIALAALGESKRPSFARAAAHVERNLASIPDGHASPAIHVFQGALAAFILGDKVWTAFDAAVLERVRAAQNPDGSFVDIIPGSPDSLDLMGDRAGNTAFITAFYAAALAVPDSRTAVLLRGEVAAARAAIDALGAKSIESPLPAFEKPCWESDVRALFVGVSRGRVVVVDHDLRHATYDAATGARLSGPTAPLADARETHVMRARFTPETFFLWRRHESSGAIPESFAEAFSRPSAEARRHEILGFDALTGAPLPSLAAPAEVLRVEASGNRLWAWFRNGRLASIDAATGLATMWVRSKTASINGALAPLGNGGVALAAESRLYVYDAEGEEVFDIPAPRRGGVTAAAIESLAASTAHIVVGRTDGSLAALDPAEGSEMWRRELGSSIRQIAFGKDDRIFALAWDGRLHALDARGAPHWVKDLGRGIDATGAAPALVTRGATVLCFLPTRGAAIELAQRNGAVLAAIPFGRDDRAVVGDDFVVVATAARLVCSRR